jgi:hypothetical protein
VRLWARRVDCYVSITESPGGDKETITMAAKQRDTKKASTNGRAERSADAGEVPSAISSTFAGVEALSVGAVNVLTGTMVSALRGMQEIGGELGSTAVVAVRGSIRAAEEISGDLSRVAKNVVSGAVSAGREVGRDMGRLASEAAGGARGAADRIASAATRAVRGIVDEATARVKANATSVRKPPQPAARRTRRQARAKRESAAA